MSNRRTVDLEENQEMEIEAPSQSMLSSSSQAQASKARLHRILTVVGLLFVVLLSTILMIAIRRDSSSGTSPSPTTSTPPTSSPPLHAEKGAVAADIPICSKIGTDMLRQGGNAIDAAVASTICQGAFGMYASGIGGGCVAMVRFNGTNYLLDARETAPSNAYDTMYKNISSLYGAQAAGVPGELKGLAALRDRFGKLSWKTLLMPTVNILRSGYNVTPIFRARLSLISGLSNDSPLKRQFLKADGEFLAVGDIYKNELLATTLETIANEGVDVFYTGRIGNSKKKKKRVIL